MCSNLDLYTEIYGKHYIVILTINLESAINTFIAINSQFVTLD